MATVYGLKNATEKATLLTHLQLSTDTMTKKKKFSVKYGVDLIVDAWEV